MMRILLDENARRVLFVRLKHPARRALFAKVRALFQSEQVESWRHCFVVASDRKLRVRRPE